MISYCHFEIARPHLSSQGCEAEPGNQAVNKQYVEDQEDYLAAVARLAVKNPRISFEEIKRLVDVED